MEREKIEKYFDLSDDLLDKLLLLNKKKEELKQLKKQCGRLKYPLIVTISGTPRSGKTTCINNLFEFFKKASFNTVRIAEPAGLVYDTLKTKKEKEKLLEHRVDFVDKQYSIGLSKLRECVAGDNDIIIFDRGIFDTLIWYNMYYKMNMMNRDRYNESVYRADLLLNNNYFYALKTTPQEALKRDYQNSLCLDERTTVNERFIKEYNMSLDEMYPFFSKITDGAKYIDTTYKKRMDASIEIADDLSQKIKKLYL